MLQKFAPLVKRQLEYWQRQIDQYQPDHPRYRPAKVERYKHLVGDFSQLLDYLNKAEGTDLRVEAGRDTQPLEKPKPKRAVPPPIVQAPATEAKPPATVVDEFADLPDELLAELSEGAKAQVDPVIKVINERGGTATLDQILVDLYRATGEVNKRTIVQNKLFRLSKRDLCWSVPGKKGIYTTTKPEGAASEEVADKKQSEKDEGPSAATDGPSVNPGVAGLPGGSSKVSTVGPTPTTSTVLHKELMSGSSPSSLFATLPLKKR